MSRLTSALFAFVFVLLTAVAVAEPATEPEAPASNDSADRMPLNYTGWAVLKRRTLDPTAADDDWISMSDIALTDNGQILNIMDGDKPTPYSVELIVITYQQTNTTVLKLALYEEGKDKAITYIWGEPGAGRLGMNLRWFQIGLTKAV